MRNILLVLTILGLCAAGGAGYLGITEREKALTEQKTAQDNKKEAESKRNDAVKQRGEALTDQQKSEQEAATAKNDKSAAEKKSGEAEKKAQQAETDQRKEEQTAQQVKTERDAKNEELKNAYGQKEQTQKELSESKGRTDAAELLQEQAQQALAKTTRYYEQLALEVTKTVSDTDKARQIVTFVAKFSIILTNNIESGDTNFLNGLEEFNKAQSPSEKQHAQSLLSDAQKKYDLAKPEINKLPKIEGIDAVDNIKRRMTESITNNIECIKRTVDFLKLRNDPRVTDTQRRDKYLGARRLKEAADKLITQVCDDIIRITADAEKQKIIPKLLMDAIKKAKEQFYQRWLPPPTESSEGG